MQSPGLVVWWGVCRVEQAATSVVSSYYPLIGAGAAVAPCPPHTEGRYIYTPVRGRLGFYYTGFMVLLNSYQSLDPLHKVVRLGDYMLKEDSLSLLDNLSRYIICQGILNVGESESVNAVRAVIHDSAYLRLFSDDFSSD